MMRWEDERYVRLFTRDTTSWKMWTWQARSLLCLLMRKLDRAGVLELGRYGLKAIAAHVDMPWEIAEPAINELIEDGVFVLDGSRIVMPNFLDAQECVMSDVARKRASRERARILGVVDDDPVTQRDSESRNVTESHAASRGVTRSHAESHGVTPSVPSVPIRAVPDKESQFDFLAIGTEPGTPSPLDSKVPSPEAIDLVSYLNAKAKRRLTPATYEKVIAARLAERRSLADLKLVVDWKVAEWLGDPNMEKRLVPDTLFRPSNFGRYLDEAREWDGKGRPLVRMARGTVPPRGGGLSATEIAAMAFDDGGDQ